MSVTPNNPGPCVYVRGAGNWATFIMSYVTGGDCFRVFDSSAANATDSTTNGGGISELTVNGANTGASSVGLHIGDMTSYHVNCVVLNFNGTGSKGVWFDNELYWTEELYGRLYVSGCTQCVVFDNPPSGANTSGGSFARIDMVIILGQGLNVSGQVYGDGVVLQNGALLVDGRLSVYGEFVLSAAATTAAVIRIIGVSPAGHLSAGRASQFLNTNLNVGVELDPSGANAFAPMSIYSDGSTFINGCYGVLDFGAGTGTFTPSNIQNNLKQSAFVTNGDVNLAQVIDTEQFTALSAAYTLANNASAQPLFNATATGALGINTGLHFFECEFDVTGLSASAHTVSFSFGGSATIGSVRYKVDTNTGAPGTLAAWNTAIFEVATASVITASVTTTTLQVRIRGVMRVTGAGTLIPQITQTTNTAAAIVGINSWFRVIRTGTQTSTWTGVWL